MNIHELHGWHFPRKFFHKFSSIVLSSVEFSFSVFLPRRCHIRNVRDLSSQGEMKSFTRRACVTERTWQFRNVNAKQMSFRFDWTHEASNRLLIFVWKSAEQIAYYFLFSHLTKSITWVMRKKNFLESRRLTKFMIRVRENLHEHRLMQISIQTSPTCEIKRDLVETQLESPNFLEKSQQTFLKTSSTKFRFRRENLRRSKNLKNHELGKFFSSSQSCLMLCID